MQAARRAGCPLVDAIDLDLPCKHHAYCHPAAQSHATGRNCMDYVQLRTEMLNWKGSWLTRKGCPQEPGSGSGLQEGWQ